MVAVNAGAEKLEEPSMQERLVEARPICESAIVSMRQALEKLGLAREVELMEVDAADFTLSTDPSNGSQSLIGVWKDSRGFYVGSIVVHSDNSFFAEYGMAAPHPKKHGWFIDAITAWGRDGVVKSEPRLLPTL